VTTAGLAACKPTNSDRAASVESQVISVDSTFREFYNRLGGRDTLGPPISNMQEIDHYRVQFTVASLMVYNPRAEPGERFFLAPLGLEFDMAEPPITPSPDMPDHYIDGHLVHENFWKLFNRLSGFSGPPLTEARYNPEKHRLEQYFASLGFYIPDNDPSRSVYLMSYGAFKCDRYCRYQSQPNAIPSLQKVLVEPFASAVLRLGLDLTGRPLTDPFQTSEGIREVIFDNLVLDTDPEDPSQVSPRPIVEELDIASQSPTTRVEDPRMDFYPTDGDLGHNIPIIFTEYLADHGTLQTAGSPVTEVLLLDEKEEIYRQCFTNLCLDYYHFPVPGEPFIRPAPLGLLYKTRFFDNTSADERPTSPTSGSLTLRVWEKAPLIAGTEGQRISVGVFNGETPIPGIVPDLKVHFPDGSEKLYFLPATSADGITSYNLTPIEARNGTLIPYEVCIQNIDNRRHCAGDDFIIWGN
jgi:hypothetical protein